MIEKASQAPHIIIKNKASRSAAPISEKKKEAPAASVSLSEKSKELAKDLAKESQEDPKAKSLNQAQQIHKKKFGNEKKPGIFFISGFDWLGASSIKGNYDGIRDMADAVEGAKHFAWDEQDKVLEEIKKRSPDQPIVLVGHSFGGDAVVEIAQELNKIENGFRRIDLLVTLDSVGFDNDFVPQNVKKNFNFIAQGNSLINDGPNLAINYERTEVINFLRPEEHAALDDSTDIQVKILEEINGIV